MLSNRMLPDWSSGVKKRTGGILLCAGTLLTVFVGIGGTWAVTAPLAGASVASGHIVAAGQNLHIQHLEGGIVKTIEVREGDRVLDGQLLFKLDETAAKALRDRLGSQELSIQARILRLTAERDNLTELLLPSDLRERAETQGLSEILAEQINEFRMSSQGHQQELQLLRRTISTLSEQRTGTEAQRAAVETQLEVVQGELAIKQGLLQQGLANRSDYTALLRTQAELMGQLGQARSNILSVVSQMAEADEKIARLQTQRRETAVSELSELRSQFPDIHEQLLAAEAVLARSTIASPANGRIISIKKNTIGSVIQPAETILEILPEDEKLIVEAKIALQDIDQVKIGQSADLRLSALDNRTTPLVSGTVIYVSADKLVDPATQISYYVARLEMQEPFPEGVSREMLYPGMPVEAYVRTGSRTFLQYILRPLTSGFEKAFRES